METEPHISSPHVLVTPLVREQEWIALLNGVRPWQPPAKHTVVVVPHPDDETLGAGGLIAAQRRSAIPVSVIAITDGEAAYEGVTGLGIVRQAEQEQALEILGVRPQEITRLRLPDSSVAAHEAELEKQLASRIHRDSLVVAPWPLDWHPDHEACGRAAQWVAKQTGAESVFYLFWTWHSKLAESLAMEPLRHFPLDAGLQALKWKALGCHRSQLERQNGEPILPEALLEPARRPFETFIVHE